MRLQPKDFDLFFHELYGSFSFPWQIALLERICETGTWPAEVDVPSGAGEDSIIAIAIFAMAIRSDLPRRIAVTQAYRAAVDNRYESAKHIARILKVAGGKSVAHRVAIRLRHLSGRQVPLLVAHLRGGNPWDESWIVDPTVPTVICGTINQIGSALLGRGYRVSAQMRPIYMGLLGNDCLHVVEGSAKPYLETLGHVARARRIHLVGHLPDRWGFVHVHDSGNGRSLSNADLKDPRLQGLAKISKPVKLVPVKTHGEYGKREGIFAQAICDEVQDAIINGARGIGIFVDRVASVIPAIEAIRERIKDAVVLGVTGRMRGHERKVVEDRIRKSLGRQPTDSDETIIVVATRCLESANVSFDAIITECAPLETLRRRFSLAGRFSKNVGKMVESSIIMRVDGESKKMMKKHPIYHDHAWSMWEALCKWKNCDLSPSSQAAWLKKLNQQQIEAISEPKRCAPLLMPQHMDILAQTSESVHADPDLSPWLHGIGASNEDVQIVWRADLDRDIMKGMDDRGALSFEEKRYFRACPPSGQESVTVPLTVARAWLSNTSLQPAAQDVDAYATLSAPRLQRGRTALCWRDGVPSLVRSANLRQGDVIAVPTAYGGLVEGHWDPRKKEPAHDIGDLVATRPRIRLHSKTLEHHDMPNFNVEEPPPLAQWLKSASAPLARRFLERGKPWILRTEAGSILFGESRELHTRDDGASFIGHEITLSDHLRGVGDQAQLFGEFLGLDPRLVSDLRLAGLSHDVGKVDPRIQRWFRSENMFLSNTPQEPLAKSAVDPALRWMCRALSDYPSEARHELSSLALITSSDQFRRKAHDWALVCHLVASHHGWCRPFAPPTRDPSPVPLKAVLEGVELTASTDHDYGALSSEIPEIYELMTRKYGWWGLAWLETILRLADFRRSRDEEY